jgi:hypothetical protein
MRCRQEGKNPGPFLRGTLGYGDHTNNCIFLLIISDNGKMERIDPPLYFQIHYSRSYLREEPRIGADLCF